METLRSKLLGAYAWITASRRRTFALALVYTIVVFALAIGGWTGRDVNDDYAISTMLSGRLFDPQGNCLFLNAVLAHTIFFMNTTFPQFNWFYVIEFTSCALSFLAISYLALTRTKPQFAAMFIALLTVFVIPGCTISSNFTNAAFTGVCAGGMFLLASLTEPKHKTHLVVLGVCFMVVGAMWRFMVFVLSIPAFGLAALAIIIFKSEGTAPFKRVLRLWPFVLTLAVCGVLVAYDASIFTKSPWVEWRDFNNSRALLSDFTLQPYDKISGELDDIGISENDYELLSNWLTEDPEFFNNERMEQVAEIAAINPRQSDHLTKSIFDYFTQTLPHSRAGVIALALILVCAATLRRRNLAFAAVFVLLAFVLAIYFYAQGRLPARVHHPIWFYSMASISIIAGPLIARAPRHATEEVEGEHQPRLVGKIVQVGAMIVPVFATLAIVYSSVTDFYVERYQAVFDANNFQAKSNGLSTYIEEHPDNVFAIHHASYRELTRSVYLRGYLNEDLTKRVIGLGGWTARSPANMTRNDNANMSNPIKDLVDNEHALYASASNKTPDLLRDYLREHYYPKADYKVVDTIKDNVSREVVIYKFSKG